MSELDACNRGDRMTWHRQQRGGYGFITRVPVVVMRVGAKRVSVLVPKRDGGFCVRSVNPLSLMPRTEFNVIDDRFAALTAASLPQPSEAPT